MKRSTLKLTKSQIGILETNSTSKACRNCLFHDNTKICQKHGLKTNDVEICASFNYARRNKIYLGGSVSAR
jgi:hypothetical protein